MHRRGAFGTNWQVVRLLGKAGTATKMWVYSLLRSTRWMPWGDTVLVLILVHLFVVWTAWRGNLVGRMRNGWNGRTGWMFSSCWDDACRQDHHKDSSTVIIWLEEKTYIPRGDHSLVLATPDIPDPYGVGHLNILSVNNPRGRRRGVDLRRFVHTAAEIAASIATLSTGPIATRPHSVAHIIALFNRYFFPIERDRRGHGAQCSTSCFIGFSFLIIG